MSSAALVEPTIFVLRRVEPPPPEAAFALAPLVALLLLFSVLYAVGRRRRRKHRAGWLATLAFGTALGNALVQLDLVLQPHHPEIVLVHRDDAPAPRADVGDGRAPPPRAAREPDVARPS